MSLTLLIIFINWILQSVSASICDYSDNGDPLCCFGWIKNVYGDCVKSECDYDCGYGKCVGLNVCECHDKTIRSEPCPPFNQKLCTNNCSNKGQCLNGKCICESGYFGEDCNRTTTSTCYVKINRGLCKTTAESLQLTKEECCSIFQVAWGTPCIFCQRNQYCPKGYILKNGQCEDIDECEIKSICLNGMCINEKGSFKCQCPQDFTLDEMTMSCQYRRDISAPDPCLTYGSSCAPYGQCIPLSDGQYKCTCRSPYEVSSNGKSCVRNSFYNVCKLYRNLCQPYGDCQPSGLSYICNCWSGFHPTEDRKSCIVKSNGDLCQNSDIAERCRGGQCISEGGSYRCICNGEYKSYNNGQECVRFNSNNDMCQNSDIAERCRGGQCISEEGSYRCICNGEYKSYNNDQECIRIYPTEPLYKTFCSRREYYSLCQGGECVDTDSNYYCRCPNGYYTADNGRRCERSGATNEGVSDNSYCSMAEYSSRCKGGQCVTDKTYGFRCLCLPGYTVSTDGRLCEQVHTDPCLTYRHKCQQGRCRRSGSNDYYCDCPDYMMRSSDGKSCLVYYQTTEPINRYCDIPSNRARCGTGNCIPDRRYGFKCICRAGYKASNDGRACNKIEPSYNGYCDIPSNRERCGTGDCVPDQYYGFKCICKEGYKISEDGRTCYKIVKIISLCGQFQMRCQGGGCLELDDNNYECQCLAGYSRSQNGQYCTKNERIPNNLSICDRYRSQCLDGVCYPRGTSDYMCICEQGFSQSRDKRSCVKDDVSTALPFNRYCDIASNRERCASGDCVLDKYYGFKCICKEGYKTSTDGRACYRINYPTTEPINTYCDIPSNRARCGTGSCVPDRRYGFKCICRAGFKASNDGRACNKIGFIKQDLKSHPSSHFRAQEPSYNGYCDIPSNRERCGTGDCVPDQYYGFKCICKEGYKVSEDGRICYKIEKIVSLCGQYQMRCQGGGCLELDDNNYECQCLQGYSRSQNGQYCTKNERIPNNLSICDRYRSRCLDGVCYPSGTSDYMCICEQGYSQSRDKRSCVKDESPKCSDNRHRCKGGPCFDIHNGYICICSEKHTITRDGRDCLPRKLELKSHFPSDFFSLNRISKSYCKNKDVKEKCEPGDCLESFDGYRCVCPHSFKANINEQECIRDEKKCPYCFYGCLNKEFSLNCSCPQTYENFYETGLCIKKSNKIFHSLVNSTCQSMSVNKTFVIKFNGIAKPSDGTSADAYESVSKWLLIKQHKSAHLSFCVPIRKRRRIQRRSETEMSTAVIMWQIVCIFDC